MSQTKIYFWLIQARNMSKHISRNSGITIKASRNTAHDKVFLFGRQIGHFTIKKKVIALNRYQMF